MLLYVNIDMSISWHQRFTENIIKYRDQSIDFYETNQLTGFCMLLWMTRFLDEGNTMNVC